MELVKSFDVIVIGGSYAGLSAAMSLGRSQRSVVIIDSGRPCNRQTPHSHNFITHDGEKPAVISAKAREQVLKYDTVKFVQGTSVSGTRTENGFYIRTEHDEFYASKLIFATGIKDTMPDIKGFADCWGITLVHCPYCHGYEFKDRKTAIIANGNKAIHLASLVRNLTEDITVLTIGKAEFDAEQAAKLSRHIITVLENKIIEVEHEDGHVKHIVLEDGQKLSFDVAYAPVPFTQHCNIPVSLGCELTQEGFIKIDNFQKTGIPGVYACGDNAGMMRSVANAVYSGNAAGAMVNSELANEQF